MRIPALITVEDFISENPDSKSIQTYLTAIRMNYFLNYKKIEERLQKIMLQIEQEKKEKGTNDIF